MMSAPSQEEVVPLVSSFFDILNINQNRDALQFEIDPKDFKSKFARLAPQLESKHLVGRLEKFQDRLFLLVGRFDPPRSRRAWVFRVLFAATISMVMIDGYFRTVSANSLTHIGDPISTAVLYTISLMGILGIHELGHIVASRWHKLRTSLPYFIPGIPVFGIPTFGALISARSFMTNRDTLFDVGISGPIAGLVIAVIVSTYGAYTAPVVTTEQLQSLFSKSEIVKIHPSLLMSATFALAGKSFNGDQVIMTPVLYAAWLGFLITFLNLLPAWQLDGGHVARAALGRKWHKITTYVGIGILIALGYWFMALFVLSFAMHSPDTRPLDDISPLSKKRKFFFIGVIALAVLTMPHPFSTMH